MNKDKAKAIRFKVQLSAAFALLIIIILYNLYINEVLDQKILGIADLNPYGAWSALKEYMTDSGYEFEGISKSIALTIAILVMTILGGRFFCGWICPIGAMQDFGSWLGRKFKAPKYKGFKGKAINPLFLKYPILLALLLLSVLGYGAIIAELSPWRAFLNLPKLPSSWARMKVDFIILASIFLLSMVISRFFCRYLCPLGAAQTLFGALSPLTLRHSKGCSRCNRCLDNCPMGIKLSSKDNIISPECIKCLECVDNCKITKDMSLSLKMGKPNVPSKVYIPLMLLLFFTIWLGMPKLWVGSSMVGNIAPDALKDGIYQGEAKGFAARIITEVRIEKGKIISIKVLDHHESKGWYEEAFMLIPKKIIRKQSLQVDAISGATKTSKGFIKSVESAVKKAADTVK